MRMVKGNAFDVRINVVRKTYNGTETVEEAIDLASAKNVTCNLIGLYGKKYSMPYTLGTDKGQMYIALDGSQNEGKYGIEVMGTLNGEAWRYACRPDEGFEIVYYTSDGALTDDISDGFVDITASVEAVGVTLQAIEDAKAATAEAEKSSISIVFKYNGVVVDVLDYDTLTASTKHKFEVYVYKGGEPYQFAQLDLDAYNIDGEKISSIGFAGGGNEMEVANGLYLADDCAYIQASVLEDMAGIGLLARRSCAVISYASNIQALRNRVSELEKKVNAIDGASSASTE